MALDLKPGQRRNGWLSRNIQPKATIHMSFISKLFGKKKSIEPIDSAAFWHWFAAHEAVFFGVLKEQKNVEKLCINPVFEKLQQVNKRFFCLAGMMDENTAELVVTPEGDIKTIVFAEEMIASAPKLTNWVFTALKPAMKTEGFSIDMQGVQFEQSNIHFVSNIQPAFPDEVELTMIHPDYTDENKGMISHGIFIYLDNALGELNNATQVDNIKFSSPSNAIGDLIPVEKLPAYLDWRQKEFVEKYQHASYNTENDAYAVFEANDEMGNRMLATVNQVLLAWDAKASHPWLMPVEIAYDGAANEGMPDTATYELLNRFEEALNVQLPYTKGYLNVGRELYKGKRTIWYACKEFRQVSKITATAIKNYEGILEITYDIFKDKYWMALERYHKPVID
ncbi:MAG: DUF695 domain-containing protein [Chitinophagaceae bacterium]